jgi:hypothetical protein
MEHSLFPAVHVIPAEACVMEGIDARLSKLKHIRIHQIINDLKTVIHAMSFHAMLQIKTNGHDELGIVGDFDDFVLQFSD